MDARTVYGYVRTLCSDLDAGRAPRAFLKTVAPAAAGLAQVLSIGCGGAQGDAVVVVRPDPAVRYVEVCNDGADNDLDGLIDCADGDCAGLAICPIAVAAYATPFQPASEVCNDNVDNDLDGLADCDDADCSQESFCSMPVALYGVPIEPSRPEICNDGIDNDRDGAVDAADADCRPVMRYMAPMYGVPFVGEICGDGLDNDRDGRADLADPDCGAPTARYRAPLPND